MTREEHNQFWRADRQSEEEVCCNLLGYGELSQYDPDCAACWLGHRHTWADHDRHVAASRRQHEAFVAQLITQGRVPLGSVHLTRREAEESIDRDGGRIVTLHFFQRGSAYLVTSDATVAAYMEF